MTRPAFYDSLEYRKKQSEITKRNQALGLYERFKKQVERVCVRPDCDERFTVPPHSAKKYCSQSCAGKVNNLNRVVPEDVRRKVSLKVSNALKGKTSPFKGSIKIAREERICEFQQCQKSFLVERWRKIRFCSVACAMKVIGSRPTSPKASRGKAGIRTDISPTIYFYSRWEANIARLYTYLGIKWEYAPRTFDIGGHTYTPDFYLPDSDTYVEVKNFLGEYSKRRDKKFREAYPSTKLQLLLKDEYLALEEKYGKSIQLWEYRNSKLLF